jgi:hypothetical protein
MLWILAGCDILKMICGSLSGQGSWTYTLYGFLKYYTPPYPTATWLLPFSLVMIFFIVSWGKCNEKEQKAIIADKESLSSTKKEETV